MATFKELLELISNPPEDGLPTDLAAQLQGAYDEDVVTYTDSAATALARATAAETRRDDLQNLNSRLLKSIPANEPNDGDPGDDHNTDAFESNVNLDDFIEYK